MINLLLIFLVVGNSNVMIKSNSTLEISFSLDKKSIGPEVTFPEAFWLHNGGEPNVPAALYKVGIPQDGDVEVQILENQETVLKDVVVEPVKYAGIYEPPVPETHEMVSVVYKENRYTPENIIEVSTPAYFRDLRTVDIRLNPVRYNPVSKELRVSHLIRIRIQFKGTPKSKPITDLSYETIYEHTLANYGQCKTWRREPKMNNNNPFASGVWYKIEVGEEGMYKIGYDEIENAGLDPEQFDPQTMKIYTASFDLLPIDVSSIFGDSLIEIPVSVQGEDDNSFDRDDYLIFYGYPASHFVVDSEVGRFENGYALNNVYWFTFGGSNGKRMAKIDATWNGGAVDTLVTEILHVEENLGNPVRSGINWYWLDISPGEGPNSSGSINIDHPKANGNAEVKVGIFTLSSGRFLYQLLSNNQLFYNETLMVSTHNQLPPYYLSGNTSLIGDSSVLTISIIRPSGTTTDLTAYLNGFDITYERITELNQSFHAFYATPQDYSLKCMTVNSTPFILDITDMKQPRLFDVAAENNQVRLSSHCDSFQLLYFSKLSLAKTATLISAIPGNLRTPANGCAYLFITHKNFSNAIMPLVNYRSAEYTTSVVSVDDIYNDFSFGKYDPLAIKHFLYYTTNNWTTTVPKYVLLVGDATYDYKNNLKKENPPNYIPMYESGSTIAGNPGIPPNYIYEGEYVNFGAGEVMILGRITVRNNQEVRDFIDKLMTYENSNIDGMWNKRIILAGDDEHSATYGWEGPGMHSGACERIIPHLPNSFYDLAKVYMVSYPPFVYSSSTKKENAQKAFIQELNRSCLAGLFFGHGNTHQLADEGLFYGTNMPQIKNHRRYFFYYFGSCTVARFDDSDYECIGEELVRIKDGAIGTMAATAGTGTTTNEGIGQPLFGYITDPDTNLTMGECSILSKNGYWGVHYLLLGDPATRLRRIENPITILATPDSVRPLEDLKITASEGPYFLRAFVRDTTHIEKFDEQSADKISSHVYRNVQSGPSSWTPFDYTIDGKEIYHGYWDADTASIIVPKITTTHRPMIKLSNFIKGKTGMLDSIQIYGSAGISNDQIGPTVVFYEGGRRLQDGDWVSKEFVLTGKTSDESGVNLLYSVANATRGFYLYLNNDIDNKIDLRDCFLYDRNSYTSGQFNVELELPKAMDTITVNVADNNDKQTVQRIMLNAEMFGQVGLENFLAYPNPLRNNQGIWFTFNLTNNGVVTIKIFTIAGRLIKTISHVSGQPGYNQVFWDTFDEYGDAISNGVYLIKGSVDAEGAKAEVIEKFIVAR